MGFAANPISLSEIESYIRLFGTPAMPIDIFVDLLGVMDNEYLKKLNGNRGPNKPPGKR